MKLSKKLKHLVDVLSIQTIRVNFKYFRFKDAIKFPIICSKHVRLKRLKGSITINGTIRTGMIKLGLDNSNIFDNKKSRSILFIDGDLIFNGGAFIGNGSKIHILPSAKIEIGNKVVLTTETTLYCSKYIKIGDGCLLSWDILIMDSDHHAIYDSITQQHINPTQPIIIGDNVWIGCRVTILKGAIIPHDSIIGSGSLVSS